MNSVKKTTLRILAVALVTIMASTNFMAQERIRFRAGHSSATVRGSIEGRGYLEYVVNGRAGQLMTIEITSGNGAVIVNAGSASGKSFSIDMTGGDHTLSIVNTGRRATTYVLTVTIK
jgi:hypothetical protein